MCGKIENIVIIGNGEDWKKEKIINICSKADYIIAADNGLSILHDLNIVPDRIIGDLDSIPQHMLQYYADIPLEKHPEIKDFTDSEICIQKAIELNPKRITLLAMTGYYLDHSYAAIVNLFRHSIQKIEMNIVTSNAIIFSIPKNITLFRLAGRRFSLFPFSPVKNIHLTGAKYDLPKKNLTMTDYSISNVVVSERLEISFEKGLLFCVLFDEGFK